MTRSGLNSQRPPLSLGGPRFARLTQCATVAAFAIAALLCLAATRLAAAAAPETFRLGFSYALFTDVNENDARASIRVLAAVIARERHIEADPEPLLLSGTEAIGAALRTERLHAIALTADEYYQLAQPPASLVARGLFAVQPDGDPTEEYVLLVRRDQGLRTLADLTGKRLTVFANSRLRLGYLWLEVLLGDAALPPVHRHFQTATANAKLSKVILDVFFKRSDAALATRRGFAAIAELNPQVGQQLVALETSPPYIPGLFAFRPNIPPEFLEHVLHEFSSVHESPAGLQTLTIFQSGQVIEYPLSKLTPALELIDRFTRLRPDLARRHFTALQHSPTAPWATLAP